MPHIRSVTVQLAVLALAVSSPVAAQDRMLNLPIGDPARKDRQAKVILDAITDTRDEALLTPDEVARRLDGVKMLLAGEEHTSIEYHRTQARIIEALVRAGRPVQIGLEMYPYTQQRFLDQWIAGKLSEAEFLQQSRWYEYWGYNWLYYRDIFTYARDNRIPMVAVNAPREVVTAVRRKGLANLTPDEARQIPKDIDVDDADHMTFFKATLEGEDAGPMHGPGMSDEMWRNMLSAQATWDAAMGYNGAQAIGKDTRKDPIMVILVGSGHVVYGVGIARQAKKWVDGPIATLVPVEVPRVHGEPVKIVRASYADFAWGVPSEVDALFPSLGISTPGGEGEVSRTVLAVSPGTPAAEAGFEAKDVLVAIDGTPLPDRETYNRLMATKRWGDDAVFTVRRGTDTLTLKAVFRRRAPARPAAGK